MIIVSNGNPKELWASLMAPPADKLSDVPIHQKCCRWPVARPS